MDNWRDAYDWKYGPGRVGWARRGLRCVIGLLLLAIAASVLMTAHALYIEYQSLHRALEMPIVAHDHSGYVWILDRVYTVEPEDLR